MEFGVVPIVARSLCEMNALNHSNTAIGDFNAFLANIDVGGYDELTVNDVIISFTLKVAED